MFRVAVKRRKSKVRIVTGTVIGKAAEPERDAVGQLRPWQRDCYAALAGKLAALVLVPTGGGKSTACRALAWYWLRRGFRVVCAVPQDLIIPSLTNGVTMALPEGDDVTGTHMNWPALAKSDLTVAGLVEWANDPSAAGIQVVTHSLLVAAHAAGAQWENVCLLGDEVHRASTSDDSNTNRLGAVVEHFVSSGKPFIGCTATFFREDATGIVSEAHQAALAVYTLPVEEHLRTAGLEAEIRFLVGPLDEALRASIGGSSRGPSITWVPPAGSTTADELGSKYDTLAAVLAVAPKPALDLVTEAGRDERKAKLFRDLALGKGPAATVCLNIGFEGYSDARLTRGCLIGARGSVRAVVQALGRLLRAHPGKSHVTFDIVLPESSSPTAEQMDRHLQCVLMALVVRWYLLPPGSLGKASALRDPSKAAEMLGRVSKAALVNGADGVAAELQEAFGADAPEVAEHIARSFPGSGGLMKEVLAQSPSLGMSAERIAGGVVAFAAKISAGRVSELRTMYEEAARVSAHQRAAVIEAFNGGASVHACAKAVGVSHPTAASILAAAGLREGERDRRAGAGERIAAAVEAVRAGTGIRAASKAHWVHPTRLSAACKAAGVAYQAANAGAAERMAAAVEAVRAGMGITAARNAHGVSNMRLSAACKAAGVVYRAGRRGARSATTRQS